MIRCCSGDTYVVPNGPRDSTTLTMAGPSPKGVPLASLRPHPVESWAVLCSDCEQVLAVVDGRRDEVYADL